MTDEPSDAPARRVRADAAARAQRAWDLRIQGWGWIDIAERVGYAHPGGARRAVSTYLGTLPTPNRAEAKELLRARAEELWRQVRSDAAAGRPGATRAGVALLQRMAQLDGLDDPSATVLITPSPEEYERTITAWVTLARQERGELVGLEADPLAPEYLDAEVLEPHEV